MLQLLCDASALTKRYAEEDGSETVDCFFDPSFASTPVITYLGYTETFATLWRKRNRGILAPADFMAAASSLQSEILSGSDARLLPLETSALLAATVYVQRYNLNASDAAILATYLRYAQAQPTQDKIVFLAADQRFLAAASAEGLTVLNPEAVSVNDLPNRIAAL